MRRSGSLLRIAAGRAALVLVAWLGGAAATPARAGVLVPGGATTFRAGDFADVRGLLVAEQEVPFTVRYEADSTPHPVVLRTVGGTLIGSVYQDPIDSTLTFVYNARLDRGSAGPGFDGTSQGARLEVGGFGRLRTDVSGLIDGADAALVYRSADGTLIDIRNAPGGRGGLPLLVVKTDATNFDARGSANFAAAEDFAKGPVAGEGAVIGSGEATIPNVFRPTAPAVAVPLPAGAYSAIGVILAFGVIAGGRWLARPGAKPTSDGGRRAAA